MQRAPDAIYADMIKMFETGTFNFAHLEPWLREFDRTRSERR